MIPGAGVVVAERYRLERALGQGGMGAVWLAHHVGLHIPCAVKFVHPEVAAAPDMRARFEREAVAAAQLRSPHVVQILDHGVWDGTPYIAMELLDGEDLDERLGRLGLLSPHDTAAIIAQVARALMRAHAAGLVHRDLKPANIFLVRDDDREIAKVLDFGVAKVDAGLATSSRTRTGALLGTPYYMSPEQAQGAKGVDHRSDLWALGVLTFQCLTGTLPFTGDALGELFVQIIVRPIPVPSRIAPVPPGFDAWWERASARDPAGRFQTARELADALAVALGFTVETLSLRAPAGDQAPASQGDPRLPPGTPSGMTASLASGAAREAPDAPAPARSRARRLVVVGVATLSLLAVGAFVAWRAAARPAISLDAASALTPTTVPPVLAIATPTPPIVVDGGLGEATPPRGPLAAAPAPPAPRAAAVGKPPVNAGKAPRAASAGASSAQPAAVTPLAPPKNSILDDRK